MANYKIDLGCGLVKKEGCIGIDINDAPNVDIVLDIDNNPLPFPDSSVQYVFSSHFLEHALDTTRIFAELSRVACDGAQLELWTPYAWTNSAFITDHKTFFNEDHYLHMCNWYTDFWKKILNSTWLLNEIQYVIEKDVIVDLATRGEDLNFAIRYYKGVVKEFCARIEVKKSITISPREPKRTWSIDRNDKRFLLPSIATPSSQQLEQAIHHYNDN